MVNAEVVMERRGKNGDRPERSRGYGFVEFATEAEALAATAALNGTTLQERDIQVRYPAQRSEVVFQTVILQNSYFEYGHMPT